jgi:hypothetical protein
MAVSRAIRAALGALVLSFGATSGADAFGISFEWGDIAPCTARRSPEFRLFAVPRGTARLNFTMEDLDAPQEIHGGGTVAYRGQVVILRGAFLYRGPCPPRERRHRYRWTVQAESASGETLGTAFAISFFPLDPRGGGWGPMPLLPRPAPQ